MHDNGAAGLPGEQDVTLVRDIFRTLTKTIKTFNVYPKDNPIYQKFATELFEKFRAFFDAADELSVGVEQYSLLFGEEEVFHSEEKFDNIALLLYADGIRQITFQKGITYEEITDLIDILRRAPKPETSDEDDIVTLLWEKNIKNMGYVAVEDTVDDDLAVEEGLLRNGDEQEGFSEIAVAETAGGEPGPTPVPAGPGTGPLSEKELDALAAEQAFLEEKPLLDSAKDLFFEILSREKTCPAFPEIIVSLGKIFDIFMQKRDVTGAVSILSALGQISGSYSGKEATMIEAAINRAAAPENLRALFGELQSSGETMKYLSLLGKDALPGMIGILGELQDRRQRRLLCEVLAEKGRLDIAGLAAGLEDRRWYLVRNIVMVLGMTREPSAVIYIAKVADYPDHRVRREAVRALDAIRTDETKNLFVSALKDSDFTVRMTALKALRRFGDPDLFPVLKAEVSREELKSKPFAEKKELLESIASLGGEKAFDLLSGLFRKSWLIEKEDITELRAAAAYGLGLLRTPDSLSLLEKEANSKKRILRDACISALKEQKSGNSGK